MVQFLINFSSFKCTILSVYGILKEKKNSRLLYFCSNSLYIPGFIPPNLIYQSIVSVSFNISFSRIVYQHQFPTSGIYFGNRAINFSQQSVGCSQYSVFSFCPYSHRERSISQQITSEVMIPRLKDLIKQSFEDR